MTTLLIDNGSTRPAAVLALRRVAANLSAKIGRPVAATPLRHADSIDAAELGGEPALLCEAFLRARLEAGEREFHIAPLFFGPARALTTLLPQTLAELRAEYGAFSCRVADTLYPLPAGEPRLAQILLEHARATRERHDLSDCAYVLTDHGSPSAAVTRVRDHLARCLRGMLGPAAVLGQAAMERDMGEASGPWLGTWLDERAAAGGRYVIVIMQFLLPGRHAGAAGDVAQICRAAMDRHPGFKAVITPLVGEHPLLVEILASRLAAVA